MTGKALQEFSRIFSADAFVAHAKAMPLLYTGAKKVGPNRDFSGMFINIYEFFHRFLAQNADGSTVPEGLGCMQTFSHMKVMPWLNHGGVCRVAILYEGIFPAHLESHS
ncbi:hypothetical protein CEXT_706951 [Caerostris extrusa]|uniref:Hemoglobin n=1 Tax=Caerostris extrusa TaxID=172846 RepID=A0AAV4PRA8_CAEEX|nr:hypothetical protein CEXT_706951 [Caerostris extrusa]